MLYVIRYTICYVQQYNIIIINFMIIILNNYNLLFFIKIEMKLSNHRLMCPNRLKTLQTVQTAKPLNHL